MSDVVGSLFGATDVAPTADAVTSAVVEATPAIAETAVSIIETATPVVIDTATSLAATTPTIAPAVSQAATSLTSAYSYSYSYASAATATVAAATTAAATTALAAATTAVTRTTAVASAIQQGHPAYPTVPIFKDDYNYIGAFMRIYVGSDSTRRWGYIFWFIVAGIFIVFSIFHASGLRSGVLGAYWSKWSLRRRTWRNRLTGGKPVSLMSNAQILTLTVLTIVTLLLTFAGPDYVAPQEGAFGVTGKFTKRFKVYVDPKLVAPFQPKYDIQKAWWTAGNRTGIMAFALFPLVILFALKAAPFAIFAIPHLVQLHFDKLSWLHRWAGRLTYFITLLHVIFWVIQVSIARRVDTGRLVLSYAFIYDPFIFAWIAFIIFTLFMLSTLSALRQKHYEIFYFLHVILAPLMILFAGLHHVPLWGYCWAALCLWFAERAWRLGFWVYRNGVFSSGYTPKFATTPWQMVPTDEKMADAIDSRRSDSVSDPLLNRSLTKYVPPQGHYTPPRGYAYAELMSGMTVRITFVAPNFFPWAPGQHFLIHIPSISRLTSHPFTCGSICDEQAPEDGGRALVFFIRAKNGWTKDLWNKVVKLISRGQMHPPGEHPPLGAQLPTRGVLLRMFVDGPFGSVVRSRFEDHSTVVIVAGGSGVSFGLSLFIYMSLCLSGRDGKYLGGRPGGWGMKNYRPTRVRFVWIVREFAHIVWCATAIRRCLDMVPSSNIHVDIFVTNFKRISDKKTGPPSPMMPSVSLAALAAAPEKPYSQGGAADSEVFLPPQPKYARSGLASRSSSVDSTDSMSMHSGESGYVDLSEQVPEYGDEERDPNDPEMATQNYVLDLTNFEGDDDAAIPGEDMFNRRIMKTGKARRRKTRKAAKAESARRDLQERAGSGETRGRPGFQHSHSSSGDFLTPGAAHERRYSASTIDSDMLPISRPGSRPPSPPGDTASIASHATYVGGEHRKSYSEDMVRAPSPAFAKEFGLSNDQESLRSLVVDAEDTVKLEVDDRELHDVSVVSEHARAGRPKFDKILAAEMEIATGSIIVACCGPTSLNAIIRKNIAKQIDPARVKRGDLRGAIHLIADEFNY